jgi:hypothetical protein
MVVAVLVARADGHLGDKVLVQARHLLLARVADVGGACFGFKGARLVVVSLRRGGGLGLRGDWGGWMGAYRKLGAWRASRLWGVGRDDRSGPVVPRLNARVWS